MTLEIIISQEQPNITPVTDNGFVESVEITCYSQLLEIIDNQCNVPWIQSNIQFLNTIKGVGISNIEKTSTVGLVDTYTITYTDGTTTTFDVTNGVEGGDGRGIVSILKTSTQELTDTYTITYTDDTTSTFDVINGVDGVSVESITLYETVGLVDTYEIVYSSGSRSYFNVTNGQNGIDGADGIGIQSIDLLSTVGKVKTYRITFTDLTTFDYDVTDGNDGINGIDGIDGENGITPTIGLNGNWYIGTTDTGVKAAGTDGTNGLDGTDGVGISNITKTGTVLNVDEYTITFTDASTFLFYVTNGLNGADGTDGLDGTNGTDGRGIVSIIKTSTVGLVDTYTVTYSDSTNSTFDVTNGEKGEEGTSAYDIYLAGGGTLSEVDFNASITDIPAHIEDATKHIDTDTAFSGLIDETNDKFTIWDNSLLKWIRFSFTSLKTYLNGIYHKFGGYSFGAKQIIGSTDNQDFVIITNNTERLTVLKNGNVGVGATVPLAKFQISHNVTNQNWPLVIEGYKDTSTPIASIFLMRGARGTIASPTAIQSGDIVAQWSVEGYGDTGFKGNSVGRIRFGAEKNFSDTSAATYLGFDTTQTGIRIATEKMRITGSGNVGIDTTDPKSKLQVAGGIQCGDDTAAASADKVGTTRYRATANASYVEMCMQVSANSYRWITIVTNTW